MDYQTNDFSIHIDSDQTLQFYGTIELNEKGYAELKSVIGEMVKKIKKNPIELNFKNLQYLNSKGIRFLIDFLTNTDKNIHIIINKKASWQKTSIAFMSKLAPEKITVIE